VLTAPAALPEGQGLGVDSKDIYCLGTTRVKLDLDQSIVLNNNRHPTGVIDISTIIETAYGVEISTGFLDRDLSKVALGELPPITIQQFVGYAAVTLAEGVFPMLDAETRKEWAEDVRNMVRRVGELSLRQINGITEVNIGNPLEPVPGADRETQPYRDNPFAVLEDGQSVGLVEPGGGIKHIVSSEDFFGLTYEVINGGILGWGAHGTYPEVQDAAVLLDSALSAQ